MKPSLINFYAQIKYFVSFLAAWLILSTPASSQRKAVSRNPGILSYVDPYIGTGGHDLVLAPCAI